MQVLNLSAVANQSISTFQDNNQYDITIQETNGCMSASVVMNGATLFTGQRIVNNYPLIPYAYIEGEEGNFVFLTTTDDNIYYTFFGDTQLLVYLSYAEMTTPA